MRQGHADNRAPSGCRVRFCAGTTSRQRLASSTKCGPGSPGRRASSWLSRLRGRPPARHRRGRNPLNQPTRDHADGATLGRWDAQASQWPRTGVEGSDRDSNIRFRARASDEILQSRSPRVPPQTMFGPEACRYQGGAPSQNRFETARPFEATAVYLPGQHPAFFRGTRTRRIKDTRKTAPPPGVPSLMFFNSTTHTP